MGTLKHPLCISCFDGYRLRVPAAICPCAPWAWESRIAAPGSRRNPAQRLSAAAPLWFFQVFLRRWGHLESTRAGAATAVETRRGCAAR